MSHIPLPQPSKYTRFAVITTLIVLLLITATFAPSIVGESGSPSGRANKNLQIMNGYDMAPKFYNLSDTDVAMLYLSIQNVATLTVQLTSVTVTHTGSGAASDITAVDFYLDDNDGIFEPGTDDTYITGGTVWSGNSMTLSPTRDLAKGVTENYIISYDFSSTASGTHGCSIQSLTDFVVTQDGMIDPTGYLPISSYNVVRWTIPVVIINATAIFKGAVPTTNFYSGETVTVKATVNHTWGAVFIFGANITIYDPSMNKVVDNQLMILDGTGGLWKRYRYNYNLPIPSPRGTYTVNLTGRGNSDMDYKDITFEVLNQDPKIIGTVGPFETVEEGTIPTKDLTSQESDLEDPGSKLSWTVSDYNTTLVLITVSDNNLSFAVQPDVFGNTLVNLTLNDTDGGTDRIWFWVNITPVNDKPWISPRVLDQEKPEDSPDWVVSLSGNENDKEDGSPSSSLLWQVADVDPPLASSRVFVDSNDNLYLGVLPDAYGSEIITLNLTDSGGAWVLQQIYVNITPVNDPPIVSPIPDYEMAAEDVQDIYDLQSYVLDIDSNDLVFAINGNTDNSFTLTIDSNDNLDASVTSNYIGATRVNISVTDGDSYRYMEFNITAEFGFLETELNSPPDTARIGTTSWQLEWSINNPGNLATVLYDLYFGSDKVLVESLDTNALEVEGHSETQYTVSNLQNDTIYYWTVIPRAGGFDYSGSCKSGVWSFSIDIAMKNEPPTVELVSPWFNDTVKTKIVLLKWRGFDPNLDIPLFYDVYISTDKTRVDNLDSSALQKGGISITANSLSLSLPEEDKIYYWTVIPSDGELTGTCLNGTWQFIMNSENFIPEVTLLLPTNGALVGSDVTLAWSFSEVDLFDEVTFEVYLDSDRAKVEARLGEVRKTASDYKEQFYDAEDLIDALTYYWWVIPFDSTKANGTCLSGIWSFTVDASIKNNEPIVTLKEPWDGDVVETSYVNLVWVGQDLENDTLNYRVYYSTDLAAVETRDPGEISPVTTTETLLRIVDLTNGTWYWTVIPNDGQIDGICVSRVWHFTVAIKDGGDVDPNGDPNGDNNGSNGKPAEDGNESVSDKSDLGATYLSIGIVAIIVALILIFMVVSKRKKERYRVQKAQKESAELLGMGAEGAPATGPYAGGSDVMKVDAEKPYKETDDAGRVELPEETDFALDRGYRPAVAAVPSEAAGAKKPTPVPVPVPTPKPVAAAAVIPPELPKIVPAARSKDEVVKDYKKHLKLDAEQASSLYDSGYESFSQLKTITMDDLLTMKGLDLKKASRLKVAVVNLPSELFDDESVPVAPETPKPVPVAVSAKPKESVAAKKAVPGATPTPTPVPVPTPAPTPVPTPTPMPVPMEVPKPVPVPVGEEAKTQIDKTCPSCGFPVDPDEKSCPICETIIE